MLAETKTSNKQLPPGALPGKHLGMEYPFPNEDEIASEMVNEMIAQVDRLYHEKRMLRQIHTKMHGCVKAVFTIEEGLPDNLRVGVFKESKSYNAWVRFSNASTNPKPDRKKDVRGIAIKLMGVPGEKILNHGHLQLSQDFLLMNTETFFSKNIAEFRKLMAAATSKSKLKMLAFSINPLHWSLLGRFMKSNVRCSNPVAINYFSTQPYQFGSSDLAVKYILKPSPDNHVVVANQTDDDYLKINLSQTLYNNVIKFDFFIQFQEDADVNLIEDPTKPWDSSFTKVATLTIPAQVFDSRQQMAFGDSLSFNSWHSLPEHRPLGSFNRVRKRAYEAMSEYRHSKNGEPLFEPTDSTDFLNDTSFTSSANGNPRIPLNGLVKVSASVAVKTDRSSAFSFISSSDLLATWLKKYKAISAVKNVEIISGPYDHAGASRKVNFENGDNVREELITFNPSANYAYRATHFSNFLRFFTNAAYGFVWFDNIDDTSINITWEYRYTSKNIFTRILLWLFTRLIFKKYMVHCLAIAKTQMEFGDL